MTYVYLTLDRASIPVFKVLGPYDLTPNERKGVTVGRIEGPDEGRCVMCRPHRVEHWKRRLLEDARAILDAEQERLRVAYEQVDDLRMETETCGTS